MKHIFYVLLVIGASGKLQANDFIYFVNIENADNDQLTIGLTPPKVITDEAIFYFPKSVPGTYSVSDFGRFVSGFSAFDKNDEKLKVHKKGENAFHIKRAQLLDSISYELSGTWDKKIYKNKIFKPSGTNFEKNQVYVLNNGGVFGSFHGLDSLEFNIQFQLPDPLAVHTTLNCQFEKNIFRADNYGELLDSPFFISRPDTASFFVDNKRFDICVFHETGKKLADSLKNDVELCVQSVFDFLGFLPIDHYEFIFYIVDFSQNIESIKNRPTLLNVIRQFKNAESGALEHKNSSFYVLLDMGNEYLAPPIKEYNYQSYLKEVVIHEFLHTVNPIGLHSEQIGDMDFLYTEMSKHLWMYEGVTEYFSHLIMLQENMMSMQEYFNDIMKNKYSQSVKFQHKKISMTGMSENVLQKKYNRGYKYVYSHGAVLGLMLDLEIIRLSGGKQNLKDIIVKLHKKYGFEDSFNDADFIDEFLSLAPEGVGDFFKRHIEGNEALDQNKYLKNIGVVYFENDSVKKPTVLIPENGILGYKMKRGELVVNGNFEITFVSSNSELQSGDIMNFYKIEKALFDFTVPKVLDGDTIFLEVFRNKEIHHVPFKVKYENSKQENYYQIESNPDEYTEKLRRIWLGQ